jgi:hypothetical protein
LPGLEGFLARGQAEAWDLPADEPRLPIELDAGLAGNMSAAIEDRFLRQPFERRTAQRQKLRLPGEATVAAIELRGRRRGE